MHITFLLRSTQRTALQQANLGYQNLVRMCPHLSTQGQDPGGRLAACYRCQVTPQQSPMCMCPHLLIRVEHPGRRLAARHHRQLPAQVERILSQQNIPTRSKQASWHIPSCRETGQSFTGQARKKPINAEPCGTCQQRRPRQQACGWHQGHDIKRRPACNCGRCKTLRGCPLGPLDVGAWNHLDACVHSLSTCMGHINSHESFAHACKLKLSHLSIISAARHNQNPKP